MADSIENWDWRCRAVTTLAAPAGIHKTGTPVYVVTSGRAEGRRITFITPSQEALALSLASRASSTALERRREVQITRVQVAPEPGTRYAIGEESAPALYDFFEACYAVVTFSFQAIEAFANRVIAEKIEPGQTYRLTRGKRSAELDAEELQRRASTDEKVTAVLPELLAFRRSGMAARSGTATHNSRRSATRSSISRPKTPTRSTGPSSPRSITASSTRASRGIRSRRFACSPTSRRGRRLDGSPARRPSWARRSSCR